MFNPIDHALDRSFRSCHFAFREVSAGSKFIKQKGEKKSSCEIRLRQFRSLLQPGQSPHQQAGPLPLSHRTPASGSRGDRNPTRDPLFSDHKMLHPDRGSLASGDPLKGPPWGNIKRVPSLTCKVAPSRSENHVPLLNDNEIAMRPPRRANLCARRKSADPMQKQFHHPKTMRQTRLRPSQLRLGCRRKRRSPPCGRI